MANPYCYTRGCGNETVGSLSPVGLGGDIHFCTRHAPYSWVISRLDLVLGRILLAPLHVCADAMEWAIRRIERMEKR